MEVVPGLQSLTLSWLLFTNLIFDIDVFIPSTTHVAIQILFRCFRVTLFQTKVM